MSEVLHKAQARSTALYHRRLSNLTTHFLRHHRRTPLFVLNTWIPKICAIFITVGSFYANTHIFI